MWTRRGVGSKRRPALLALHDRVRNKERLAKGRDVDHEPAADRLMAWLEATPGIDIGVAVLALQLEARSSLVLERNDHGFLPAHEQGPGKIFEIWVSH